MKIAISSTDLLEAENVYFLLGLKLIFTLW